MYEDYNQCGIVRPTAGAENDRIKATDESDIDLPPNSDNDPDEDTLTEIRENANNKKCVELLNDHGVDNINRFGNKI